MTLDELKQRRIELGFSYQELSELSKVPLGTIQKVFGGITSRPRRETILKLEGVLGRKEQRMPSVEVRDAAAAYQYEDRRRHVPNPETNTHEYDRQGEYTLEDYYALPDEQRVELINGVFYDMGAPTSPHQIIGGRGDPRAAAFIPQCPEGPLSSHDVSGGCAAGPGQQDHGAAGCDHRLRPLKDHLQRDLRGAGLHCGSPVPFNQEEGHDAENG